MGSEDVKVDIPQAARNPQRGSGSGSRMQYRCSFCGKGQDEVQRLIAGPGAVYICDECVVLCQETMTEEAPQLPAPPIWEAEPFRPIAEMLQDDRFLKEAATRDLVFQVGHDKRIKVFEELDHQNYIFGVGPRGQSIVYRVVDEDELRDLDQSLSGESEHEPG